MNKNSPRVWMMADKWESVLEAGKQVTEAYETLIAECRQLAVQLGVNDNEVIRNVLPKQRMELESSRHIMPWIRWQDEAWKKAVAACEEQRGRKELIERLKLTAAERVLLGID